MIDDAAAGLTMMSLRYAGSCRKCSAPLAAGTWAGYERASRSVVCVACAPDDSGSHVVSPGVAGASAQREFDRRHTRRETTIRDDHPHLGELILAISDDPQSTRAWATGAEGEVALGRRLDAIRQPDVRVIHDRRIPGSKANIDHIAIGPRGVFVIDAKHYKGAPTLRVEGGLFSPRVEKLMIRGRDKTSLVPGVLKQMDRVMTALEASGMGQVPVFGMMCFYEAGWPLIGGNFEISGVEVLWPRKAVSRVTSRGSYGEAQVQTMFDVLARYFPAA